MGAGRRRILATRPIPLWPVSCSAAPIEQAGYRPVAEDLLDGPPDEWRDRQHGELVEALLRGDGQGAGDDDLADPRVLELIDRGAGQHSMRGRDDHLRRTLGEQR